MASLKEGEWSCYGGCHVNWWENGHVTEVVTLMEGEWSCYRGGHLNGGRMVMLQRWSLYWRENGHVTEVVFNRGSMVMLQRRSV